MKPDFEALRADFPILKRKVNGHELIYFDNAATSQTPRVVVDAVDNAYYDRRANVHRGVHSLSQEATAAMEATRERVRAFVNADSTDEIIFTRGTTEAINLVASSYGQLLEAGDEIILTIMEHHSNIVPWQLLQNRKGIVIKVVPIHADGTLDLDVYRSLFTGLISMPFRRTRCTGPPVWACSMAVANCSRRCPRTRAVAR